MDEGDLEAEHAPPRRSSISSAPARRARRAPRRRRPPRTRRDACPGRAWRGTSRRACRRRARRAARRRLVADADRRRLDALLLDARAVLEPARRRGARTCRTASSRSATATPTWCTELGVSTWRSYLKDSRPRCAPPPSPSSSRPLAPRRLRRQRQQQATASRTARRRSRPAGARRRKGGRDERELGTRLGEPQSGGTPITLDLSMARGKGAKGSMSTNGLNFDLVRIGDTVYIRGSDAFYKQLRRAPPSRSYCTTSGSRARRRTDGSTSLAALTSIAAALRAASAPTHGKLTNDGKTTYKGRRSSRSGTRRTTASSTSRRPASRTRWRSSAARRASRARSRSTTGTSRCRSSAPSDAIDISQFGG